MLKKKDFFLGCVFIVLMLLGSIDEPIPAETVEPTETIIKWKEEVAIEEPEIVTVAEPIKEIKFYNVPLDEELQLHIFAECEQFNISPAIILAMIEKESCYMPDEIGDGGNSYGLMQVQPQWTEIQAIMEEVGCTDLLDPYQNVSVGIRWVAQIRDTNPDVYWVLMRYNGGPKHANDGCATGNYSEYAIYVIERASELEAEHDRNAGT